MLALRAHSLKASWVTLRGSEAHWVHILGREDLYFSSTYLPDTNGGTVVQIQGLPLISCVPVGELWLLSEPQFFPYGGVGVTLAVVETMPRSYYDYHPG